MLREYSIFIIFGILAIGISLIVFGISYIGILKQYDLEKISVHECGFDPFEDTRKRFNVKFYLVALLFLIFDLEVTYLFPWAMVLNKIDFYGYLVMVIFLILVTLGFIYEWMKGALEWE